MCRGQAQLPIIPTYYLQFQVERDNIVQSALENVEKYWDDSDSNSVWLKPLKVNFEGEYAIDVGGPSKEFFHCLFSALLDPDLHIFRKIDDHAVSSNVWFNPEYLDYSTLEKIGLLFALLIFNEAVTTVPFPEQLYEKLLSNRDPEAIDLEKMDQGFVKQLREIEAENVEALDLDFEELRPGDENVPVTKENLELYIKEKMTKRLAIPQLAAFTKGFNRLASMTPLMKTIFKAEDLRDVILGEELDWNAFRLSVYYLDPYCEDHKVIKMFWKVFDEFEENDKRQFLKFLTCADHVPVGGFVRFPVRRLDNKADKYLDPDEPNKYPEPGNLMPEVMTCKDFLSMDLPEYETEEDLRFRLKMAIETRGFHLEVEAPPCVSATAPFPEPSILQQAVQGVVQLLFGGRR
ncbi:ubiquitin-protein ligase E3A [Strongylocentrotus purpuratus]|uniref:HECT-type E3 ubiquitin transferase n=1 Tax=Strongylocentrotus purpuratus TaxID=7668 RepID=A0A7M7N2C8_STRPU|nr:ubiquitin-protein ligase E3A [Strongylocentrotus purpuratus]